MLCSTLSHLPRQSLMSMLELRSWLSAQKIKWLGVTPCITVWLQVNPRWLNDHYEGKDRKFLFLRVIHAVFHLELSIILREQQQVNRHRLLKHQHLDAGESRIWWVCLKIKKLKTQWTFKNYVGSCQCSIIPSKGKEWRRKLSSWKLWCWWANFFPLLVPIMIPKSVWKQGQTQALLAKCILCHFQDRRLFSETSTH